MRRRGGTGRACAAVAAALLLPGCDVSWNASSGDGKTRIQGSSTTSLLREDAFALEPPSADRAPVTLPDASIALRFTASLDAFSARGAVRVEDDGRRSSPVPVEIVVRDRELEIRPAVPAVWRAGATLVVRVAGMPSLRALRSAEGVPLREEAVVRVIVRSPRRTDRAPPFLAGSDPAPGAAGVDPAAAIVLRFSEPMDARGLSFSSRGSPWEPVTLEAEGRVLGFRAFLDRTRRELTVLPSERLPSLAAVEVGLTDRARDGAGNRLAAESPRRVSFTTSEGTEGGGRLVEAFEDDSGLDALGTTVRWDHPFEPGLLSGVVEPRVIPTGGGAEERTLRLDPRGGSLRMLVPAADLGDEPRILRGLQFLAAPGGAATEIIEPRVRLTSASPLTPWEETGAESPGRLEVTEGMRGAPVRAAGGGIPIAFRHPWRYDGATPLVLELSWKGTVGTVFLRADLQEETRCVLAGADAGADPAPESAALRISPLVRFDTLGERAVARSRWMEAPAAHPAWLDPATRPSLAPGLAVLRFQGAPPAEDGADPDLDRASPWTEDVAALAGLRWIRFRVIFPQPAPGVAPPVLDRLELPFAAR